MRDDWRIGGRMSRDSDHSTVVNAIGGVVDVPRSPAVSNRGDMCLHVGEATIGGVAGRRVAGTNASHPGDLSSSGATVVEHRLSYRSSRSRECTSDEVRVVEEGGRCYMTRIAPVPGNIAVTAGRPVSIVHRRSATATMIYVCHR